MIDEKDRDALKQNIDIALSIRLYKLQKITIGKAAQIAGMSHLNFECLLSDNEVPISALTIDDVMNDVLKLD